MSPQKCIAIVETRRYVIPVDDDFPDVTHPDFHDRATETWCSIESEREHQYLNDVVNTQYLPV
jgi:hypothetical protein